MLHSSSEFGRTAFLGPSAAFKQLLSRPPYLDSASLGESELRCDRRALESKLLARPKRSGSRNCRILESLGDFGLQCLT